MMKLYEEQGVPVDELLIGQYVQNAEIAKRFSVYYDLFTKYRADYQIERILEAPPSRAWSSAPARPRSTNGCRSWG